MSVPCLPSRTAVVVSPASRSGSISGMALYACIAIAHSHAAPNPARLNQIILLPATIHQITDGRMYNTLNIPSTKGFAFARMGSAL